MTVPAYPTVDPAAAVFSPRTLYPARGWYTEGGPGNDRCRWTGLGDSYNSGEIRVIDVCATLAVGLTLAVACEVVEGFDELTHVDNAGWIE